MYDMRGKGREGGGGGRERREGTHSWGKQAAVMSILPLFDSWVLSWRQEWTGKADGADGPSGGAAILHRTCPE